MEKKKNLGAIARDLLLKEADQATVGEMRNAQLSEYEDNVGQCIKTHRSKFNSDFFVVVITKKEKLMPNVLRHYYLGRRSCPTPDYDQAVYKYHYEEDKIEFIWVIPSKPACIRFKNNVLMTAPEERALRDFVLDFADGTLYRIARKLNKED